MNITDPGFTPKTSYNFFERQALRLIRDERDLPFIKLMARIMFIIIPISVLMFFWFKWWIAVPFMILNIATGVGPFILMLHNTSHRKLFKQEYRLDEQNYTLAFGAFLRRNA